MSLENASPELQLAVDLIYLLECNEIDPVTALAALDIVKRDYQKSCSAPASPLPICLPDSEQDSAAVPFVFQRLSACRLAAFIRRQRSFTSCTSLPCWLCR